MGLKAIAAIAVACGLILVGCGDGDEPTPEGTTAQQQQQQQTAPPKPKGDAAQIRQVAASWAPLFGAGDPAMCEYLDFEIAEACSIYADGEPSVFVASFAGARLQDVKITGTQAVGQFSNGEAVEFSKSPSGGWAIANLGG